MLGIVWETFRQIWYRVCVEILHRRHTETIDPAFMGIVRKSKVYIAERYIILIRSLPLTYHILNFANQVELDGETALAEHAEAYGMMMLLTGSLTLHPLAQFYWRKAEAALRQCQEHRTEGLLAQAIATYGLSRARWDQADNRLAAEKAKQIGNMVNYTILHAFSGHALHFQARWDEQRELMSGLLEFCRRQNDTHFSNICLWHLAESALRRGHQAEALALLDECQPDLEAVEDKPHVIASYGMRVQIHLARGEMELARRSTEQALKLMFLPLACWAFTGYAGVVEYYLTQLEQKHSLRQRWQASRAMLHMHLFAFMHDVGKPRLAVYACWQAGLAGNYRQAARRAREGLRLAQQLHMPYDEALLHYHLGRYLPPKDPARREHLAQAKAIFEQLGAAYDAEMVRKLL